MKQLCKLISESEEFFMRQYYDNGTYLVNQDHPYFEGIPGSYFDIDSEFSINGEGDRTTFSVGYYGGHYPEFAPKITVEADMEDGIVYFNPTISMPPCSSEDLDYGDSFLYLADMYKEAAQFATYLIKNPLNTEYYYDEEE
jgi:hypothetical protein